MLDPLWQKHIEARCRVLQLIVAALLAGCVGFAAVAVVLGQHGAGGVAGDLPLGYVGLAVAAAVLVSRPVVGVALGNQLQNTLASGSPGSRPTIEDLHAVLGYLQTRTFVGGAMFEGATFFLLIVYLLTGDVIPLAAAGVMLLGLALHFPTRGGMTDWVESRLERLAHDRQLPR